MSILHKLKKTARPLRRSPFHPQWLMCIERSQTNSWLEQVRGTVVDIGCADKRVRRHLPSGCRYIGIDLPATAQGLYGTFPDVFADAAALPIARGTVDCVLLMEVLEHLPCPEAAIAEAARVLRHEGKLVLTMPFLYPVHDEPYDFQRLTSYGLKYRLTEAGFKVEDIRPVLGGFATSALLCCLAIGDGIGILLERRRWLLPLAPLMAACIPVCNIFGWAFFRLIGRSDFMAVGHQIVAVRIKT